MIENYLETYEYGIISSDFIDVDVAKKISNAILEKESFIINLADNTKVPFKHVNKDSITQYHYYYSLLELGIPEIDILISKIKEIMYKDFGWQTFYIKMWANIYRSGDYIGLHKHMDNRSDKKFHYAMSGHCFLYSTESTATTFLFKNHKKHPLDSNFNDVDIPNNPGEITIFSSYIEHEFKKWDGDLRVSLAFDLNNEPDADIQLLEKWKFIKV